MLLIWKIRIRLFQCAFIKTEIYRLYKNIWNAAARRQTSSWIIQNMSVIVFHFLIIVNHLRENIRRFQDATSCRGASRLPLTLIVWKLTQFTVFFIYLYSLWISAVWFTVDEFMIFFWHLLYFTLSFHQGFVPYLDFFFSLVFIENEIVYNTAVCLTDLDKL